MNGHGHQQVNGTASSPSNGTAAPNSHEGYQWTRESGLKPGLPCVGVITPSQHIPSLSSNTSHTYDVIVVGAGYAGLTAARDLTVSGYNVLLVEARDRIGGRTWSSTIDGYPYELGGTWVHWNQPFVYREISRYNLIDSFENSHDLSIGNNQCVLTHSEGRKVFTRAEEATLTDRAVRKFCNVDGVFGRAVIPMPALPFRNPEFAKYEKMSFADRMAQIRDDLTLDEHDLLEGFLSMTSGGSLEESSFGEMLRWWALCNYDMQLFVEELLMYKFRHGQSVFARKFFDEAQRTKRFEYIFSKPVQTVKDDGSEASVTTRDGETFRARRVICTLPLNVLADIEFQPPLHPLKVEASRLGHVQHGSKVHVECANPELRSFSGTTANPHHNLTYIFGDGTTPAGNTHLVAFGSSYKGWKLEPEEDIDKTINAFQFFVDGKMDVQRVVFHNWSRDEFAKGAWEWLRPDTMARHLEPLRQRQGNILFGSADWASLWRGFIDGAIEDGGRVAKEIQDEMRPVWMADHS